MELLCCWSNSQSTKSQQPFLSNTGKWTRTQEGSDYKYEDFIIENNGSKNRTGKDKKMQGLLALVDSREDDGGFCCVPGFHRNVATWAKHTEACDWAHQFKFVFDYVPVPKGDKVRSFIARKENVTFLIDLSGVDR
jgi:hypothetical protein